MSQALTARVPAAIEAATADAPAAELSTVWRALWRSRLLVWVVGAVAFIVLGTASGAVHAFDPTHSSVSFGQLGNVLAAPAVRWDSIWYLQIAHGGYQIAQQASFYPLYPLLIRAGSVLTGSLPVAGVLVSLVAMSVGLALVYRLTALELGSRFARATVDLIAFGPMALFLSAVYTGALFLALSTGTFYAARRGRWAMAGALGGLAALTRVTGVLLVVPVVLIFFYGPRGDASPASVSSRWLPRYRWTRQILWAALIPGGLALFSGYLALRGFGPTAMVRGQEHFYSHQLIGPFAGIWDGAVAAWHEIRLELAGVPPSTYSSQALLQFGGLIVAGVALIGAFRRLPLAYGAYAALGLLLPLSTPTAGDPLRGLDRYASVLFPLFMWAAAWATERRAMRPLLIVSSVLLAFFTAQFATWHWVGTPLL